MNTVFGGDPAALFAVFPCSWTPAFAGVTRSC
jgi:hypothetical protein